MEGRSAGLAAAVAAVLLAGCGDGRVDVLAVPLPPPECYEPGEIEPAPDGETITLAPAPYEVTEAGESPIGSRCYFMDPAVSGPRHVTGWRIVDPAPAVRRVLAFRVGLPESSWGVGFGGFDCSELGYTPPRALFATTAGRPDGHLPAGLGLSLADDERILLAVGYDASRATELPAEVDVQVELRLAEAPVETEVTLFATVNPDEPEGGTRSIAREASLTVESGRLFGAVGITNDLARSLRLELVRGDETRALQERTGAAGADPSTCLFVEPLAVQDGNELRARCVHDTTGIDGSVGAGLPTEDEPRVLCLGAFYHGAR